MNYKLIVNIALLYVTLTKCGKMLAMLFLHIVLGNIGLYKSQKQKLKLIYD
jgi:hypothetical protein